MEVRVRRCGRELVEVNEVWSRMTGPLTDTVLPAYLSRMTISSITVTIGVGCCDGWGGV